MKWLGTSIGAHDRLAGDAPRRLPGGASVHRPALGARGRSALTEQRAVSRRRRRVAAPLHGVPKDVLAGEEVRTSGRPFASPGVLHSFSRASLWRRWSSASSPCARLTKLAGSVIWRRPGLSYRRLRPFGQPDRPGRLAQLGGVSAQAPARRDQERPDPRSRAEREHHRTSPHRPAGGPDRHRCRRDQAGRSRNADRRSLESRPASRGRPTGRSSRARCEGSCLPSGRSGSRGRRAVWIFFSGHSATRG